MFIWLWVGLRAGSHIGMDAMDVIMMLFHVCYCYISCVCSSGRLHECLNDLSGCDGCDYDVVSVVVLLHFLCVRVAVSMSV